MSSRLHDGLVVDDAARRYRVVGEEAIGFIPRGRPPTLAEQTGTVRHQERSAAKRGAALRGARRDERGWFVRD